MFVAIIIKDELSKSGGPEEMTISVLDDIFGKKVGTTFLEGLINPTDESDFDEMLEVHLKKWNDYKSSLSTLYSTIYFLQLVHEEQSRCDSTLHASLSV